MQKVGGSNPLSSTIFRMPVRLKSTKLLVLDHGLTCVDAQPQTAGCMQKAGVSLTCGNPSGRMAPRDDGDLPRPDRQPGTHPPGHHGCDRRACAGEKLPGPHQLDRTYAGCYLLVVTIAEGKEAFVVSARDMTDAEKKTFRRKAR